MAGALLEVDLQGWILGMAHDPDVAAAARTARAAARAEGWDVICLRYLAHDGPHADPDAADVRFLPGLEPVRGDLVLSKWTRNAFDNPDLATNLGVRGIARVALTGLLTDRGVVLAARSALALGLQVDIIAAACAGSSADAHVRALRDLAADGARVVWGGRRV